MSSLPPEPLGSKQGSAALSRRAFYGSKILLRQRILQHRRELNLSYMSGDAIVSSFILDACAAKIAAYVSSDKEVDTRMMIAQVQHYHQQVFLPVIRGQELYFCLIMREML